MGYLLTPTLLAGLIVAVMYVRNAPVTRRDKMRLLVTAVVITVVIEAALLIILLVVLSNNL